jgi:hypothetical protein
MTTKNESKSCGRKPSWPNLRYYHHVRSYSLKVIDIKMEAAFNDATFDEMETALS